MQDIHKLRGIDRQLTRREKVFFIQALDHHMGYEFENRENDED